MRAKVTAEGECRICGSRQNLEAAHIIPRSLGGGMKALDCIPLCRAHHSTFDAHRLDVLHALTYAEQAEAVRVLGIERARERFVPSEYREDAIPSAGYR
jgi:hypothetical protein